MKQRRAIAFLGAIEKKSMFLSQYIKCVHCVQALKKSYFVCTYIIFTDRN